VTVTADVDQLLLGLMSPDGRADPYPYYHRFHRLGAVHRSPLVGKVVSGYRACDAVLRDPRAVIAHDRDRPGRPDPRKHESLALLNRTILMTDPPDHTRLRRLVSRAFTPRTVAALGPAMHRLLHELLAPVTERAAAGEVVDLMDELAFPFPVRVIGQLVGVPATDQTQFQRLVRDLTLAMDLIVADADLARADAAAAGVTAYFEELVARRRRQPADDLASALLGTGSGSAGEQLTESELPAMLTLLFLAGFETTTNLIGNGVLALLRHPDQLAALAADPTAVPAAIEELLRYDPPVQMVARWTAAPLALPDGTTIDAHRSVLVLLGAANRDPAVYVDPDRLLLNRDEASPVSFGGGIHSCLGAGLARLEARLVLTELLRRFATIELADEPTRRTGASIRGLARLPLWLAQTR
jgi:cytochrome P450